MPRRETWFSRRLQNITKTSGSLIAAGLVALVLLPSEAEAYIGPGAGISALGAVAALIGAFVLLVVGFVWYPVKRLRRRMKAAEAKKHG